MFHIQSRLPGLRAEKIALCQTAILVCSTVAGCNAYRTPQIIDPATELRMSEKSIAIGSGTLKVPFGWKAEILERYDEKGRPLTVSLVRSDKRGRIAYMAFESLKERPSWRGNVDVHEASTEAHKRVIYDITSAQEPSGDDTPANFTIDAYVKKDDTFWYMHVRFMTPVRPDLIDAVKYIDAIVVEGKRK